METKIAFATIDAHAGRPGDLIEVLHQVQETLGYVPVEAQDRIAEALGLPISQVYGVVTFYHFFSMHPRGDHTIKACLGTACYVRGARKRVLGAIKEILGIVPGETTPDRKFSLDMVRCLGACGLAPAVMIDEQVVGRLTPARLRGILGGY